MYCTRYTVKGISMLVDSVESSCDYQEGPLCHPSIFIIENVYHPLQKMMTSVYNEHLPKIRTTMQGKSLHHLFVSIVTWSICRWLLGPWFMSVVTTDVGQYVSSRSIDHLVVTWLICESSFRRSVGNHPVDYGEFSLRCSWQTSNSWKVV